LAEYSEEVDLKLVELQKGLDGLCPSRNRLGIVEKDNVLYIGGSFGVNRYVETGVEKAAAGLDNLKSMGARAVVGVDFGGDALVKGGVPHVRDLGSVNGTAIYRGGEWVVISRGPKKPGDYYPLRNGDLIALAYSEDKGPYLVITVKMT